MFQGSSLFARCVFMRAKSWVVCRAPGWMKAAAVDRVRRKEMRIDILASTQLQCFCSSNWIESAATPLYTLSSFSDRHLIYIGQRRSGMFHIDCS